MSPRNRALAAAAAALVVLIIVVAVVRSGDDASESAVTSTSSSTPASTSTTASTTTTTEPASTTTTSSSTSTTVTSTTTVVATTVAPATTAPPPTTAAPAADEASLRSAVATFVDTSLPYEARARHLEDGAALEQVVRQFEVFAPSLEVTNVAISGTRATFAFSASGVGASAEAVFADGRWQVTRESFCALVAFVGVACPG